MWQAPPHRVENLSLEMKQTRFRKKKFFFLTTVSRWWYWFSESTKLILMSVEHRLLHICWLCVSNFISQKLLKWWHLPLICVRYFTRVRFRNKIDRSQLGNTCFKVQVKEFNVSYAVSSQLNRIPEGFSFFCHILQSSKKDEKEGRKIHAIG